MNPTTHHQRACYNSLSWSLLASLGLPPPHAGIKPIRGGSTIREQPTTVRYIRGNGFVSHCGGLFPYRTATSNSTRLSCTPTIVRGRNPNPATLQVKGNLDQTLGMQSLTRVLAAVARRQESDRFNLLSAELHHASPAWPQYTEGERSTLQVASHETTAC